MASSARPTLPLPRWLARLVLVVGWLLALPGTGHASYSFTTTSYAWETTANTISSWIGTCTSYAGDDDRQTLNFTGGFTFPFNGTNYSSVSVHINGGLQFGSETGLFRDFTASLPAGSASPRFLCASSATVNMLYVYSADLQLVGGSSITWEIKGTAPARYLVVSWNAVYDYNSGQTLTFQAILHESGLVKYQYASGLNATSRIVGVQVNSSDYKLVPFNSTNTANGTAVLLFDPGPGGVPGAAWWSRASSLGLADGTGIATWTNIANSAKNLTGSTTRPVFRNNNSQNINFNPVVEFTSATVTAAAAQFFTAPSMAGFSSFSAGAYVFVGYPTSTNQQNNVLHEKMSTPFGEGGGGLTLNVSYDNSDIHWNAGSWWTNQVLYSASRLANAPSIYTATMDPAASPTQATRQDGSVMASTTSSRRTMTGNNSSFRVGWCGELYCGTFRGLMAEGALYLGTSPSATQVSRLESYLAVKYGITLGGAGASGVAYLNSTGSTIWAASSGYHNNITGLGRDDSNGLDQRISRSINSGSQITITTGASMPSTASTVSAQSGVAFGADRSYLLVGDNGSSAASTTSIAAGSYAGYIRSARLWRVQRSGTVPTQLTVCIPDALLPAALTTGTVVLLLATDTGFTTGLTAVTVSAGTCAGSGVGVTAGVAGRVATLPSAALTTAGTVAYFTLAKVMVDHLEITTSASAGLTCTPTTFTVKACSDAACSSVFTGGLSGTLSLTGAGMTVNYPSGAAFTIASGASTTTVSAHITTVGAVTASATGVSPTPSNVQPVFCGFGVAAAAGNSCSFSSADSGLLFDVPDQLAETSVQVTVQAVRKSDNSLACTPAFANVTRSVNFRCSYTNPTTGTLPVRIGGTALNASGSASAACDGTGRAVSLSFNGSGIASTSAQYADVGQIALTATYTGSGSDAGLAMTGSDSFRSAPFDFAVSGVSGSAVAAGTSTSATVTARNYLGNATPNFGRETSPESVTLGFVRAAPTGTGAVSGSFSGTLGSFSNGVATASNIAYTEVGKVDIVATLTSAGYLGSSYRPAGSSHGAMVWCADEGGTCMLPAGTVNTVWYAADTYGAAHVQSGASTAVGCYNPAWSSDPWVGIMKRCWYVATSGVNSSNTGTLTLRPHRFEVSATAACPAGNFTYAGQSYAVTVTARNAAGGTTVNYDGTAATSPNQARAVTLSDANSLGLGSLTGNSIALTAFTAGVASGTPTYSFTAKQTAPQSLVLRATDSQGTSSAGYTEASMPLRSGRLRLSNAFGKSGSALQVPVTAEYWSGSSWVVNSADGCTTVPSSAVALSNPRDATGAATATSTSASAITLSAGRGTLTLAAPSPANASLTVDLSLNLGSTAADQSCLAAHPATTGAARPWLRSLFGNCAATADRDPAARASFGVYSPETRKTVHLRELF